jgi:flagellar biosynthetic protein FlhB
MAEDQEERTEQATDQRREDFRKRGQVPVTRELSTAVFFLAAAGMMYAASRYFLQNVVELFGHTFGPEMLQAVKSEKVTEIMGFIGFKLLILVAPIFLISMVIGIASQVMQTGLLQIENALSPDINKLNPLNSLGRIFSLKGFVELCKSMLKLVAISIILYLLLKGEIHKIPYLSALSVEQILTYLGMVVFKLLLTAGIFMLVLSVADYFFQKWQLEREMMMTKQEVKEEHKSREGDPLIKARIRKVQREIATRKMMSEIPKGDVVITNPTHIACVLKYSDKLPAPQLIAKGADYMAEKIKQIARENNIPIVENKPLARTIFKTMKVGQVIPRELFVAVAEVLSYVYRLRRKKKKNNNSSIQAERGL